MQSTIRNSSVLVFLLYVEERVHDADCAVQSIMLKIFRKNLAESVVFRVGPKMCIEPIQLIGSTSANRMTKHSFLRVKNCKLSKQFLRFAQRIRLSQNDVTANGACHHRDKFHIA